jgi:hypothetical protein
MRPVTGALLLIAAGALLVAASSHDQDTRRPVCQLGNTSMTLQWFTKQPCETKVQMRMGGAPCMTPLVGGSTTQVWNDQNAWIVAGKSGTRTYHRLIIRGLLPSTRYYYRIYDPGAEPTADERAWGAAAPWRREFAINTHAVPGRRTIVRVPVKVLIMPNVILVSSAFDRVHGQIAPDPPALARADIEKIKEEYRIAERFLFINSGFRMWHDFQLFFDERWQRWGIEPTNAAGMLKGLPPCRNWAGGDYVGPGGGEFTPFDTRAIETPGTYPMAEQELYAGQIENALVRRWNPATKKWEFMRSGGGTLGIDGWARGVPGRSQFLGDDLAWLTTHEYHHQIESQGWFSGLNTEDDRVFFCHFSDRYRTRKPDGSVDEFPWSTAGKFGEHWSGIAQTDRQLSDMQWLRWYFGEPLAVDDGDRDCIPDQDPRLPFDETRFGSDPRNPMTDGEVLDITKVGMSIWSPGPLQSMWTRPAHAGILPRPRSTDSDHDDVSDLHDPEPLVPFPPFVWPGTATLDGQPNEWNTVPLSGRIAADEGVVMFAHCHDQGAYYGLVAMNGDWRDVRIVLDGEGDGVWGPGVGGFGGSADGYWITIKAPAASNAPPTVTLDHNPGGFTYVAKQDHGKCIVEFRIGSRGDSTWFWEGGGREIGIAIDAGMQSGARYAMFDGYDPVYCTMLPPTGKQAPPVPPPPPLTAAQATRAADYAGPDARKGWRCDTKQWQARNGALAFVGHDDTLLTDVPATTNFQIRVEFEAARDLVLGAFRAASKRLDPGVDYIAFAGGYENTLSKIRVEGRGEVAGDTCAVTPGRHTMQFARCNNILYLQLDDKLVGWYHDTEAPFVITRLGVVGIPKAGIVLHALLVRAAP